MKNKKTYVVHTVHGKAGESVVNMSEAADVKREYVSVFFMYLGACVYVCTCVGGKGGSSTWTRQTNKMRGYTDNEEQVK